MPNIYVKCHLVQKLLSGYRERETHTHRHTQRPDCSTWTTKVVDNGLESNVRHDAKLLSSGLAMF